VLDRVRRNTEKREGRQSNIENRAKVENEGERHEGARSRVTEGESKGGERETRSVDSIDCKREREVDVVAR